MSRAPDEHRPVLESFLRWAERIEAEVRAAIGGAEIGQGSMAPVISDALLDALLTAYREAAATSGWRAPADAQADWVMV